MKSLYRSVVTALVASACCAAPVRGAEIRLDFNSPPEDYQDGYGMNERYVEEGFAIHNYSIGSIIRFNPVQSFVLPSNGTIHFGATESSSPVLYAMNSTPFSIVQIDLAHYSAGAPIVSPISFRGNKADGTFVNASFAIGTVYDPQFHTFMFGPQWTGLTSVDFLSDIFAWDNIVVVTVPEPGVVPFSFMAVLVWVVSSRRRADVARTGN